MTYVPSEPLSPAAALNASLDELRRQLADSGTAAAKAKAAAEARIEELERSVAEVRVKGLGFF